MLRVPFPPSHPDNVQLKKEMLLGAPINEKKEIDVKTGDQF
jgi:hypothetical protein